jgi:hypothetical protein
VSTVTIHPRLALLCTSRGEAHDRVAQESEEAGDRRALLQVMVGAAPASAPGAGIPEIAVARVSTAPRRAAHLYLRTNEIRNALLYYRRSANNAFAEPVIQHLFTASPIIGARS